VEDNYFIIIYLGLCIHNRNLRQVLDLGPYMIGCVIWYQRRGDILYNFERMKLRTCVR
jgi:hypothetical protein